jgi:hypothetical protein
MTKVTNTSTVEVPDGPVCVNWGYRTFMPKELEFHCPAFRDESQHLSASDAMASGLGYSGGTIRAYRCRLFDVGLDYEFGVGPKKCNACLKQSGTPEAKP